MVIVSPPRYTVAVVVAGGIADEGRSQSICGVEQVIQEVKSINMGKGVRVGQPLGF